MVGGEVGVADKTPDTPPLKSAPLEDHVEHLMNFLGLPTNQKMFIRGVAGFKTPIDEKYFKPEDLDSLRRWVMVNEAKKAKEDPKITAFNISRAVKAGSKNPEPDLYTPGPDGNLVGLFGGPERLTKRAVTRGTYVVDYQDGQVSNDDYRRANTTLGQFRYEVAPNGDIIAIDHYDFNASAAPWGTSLPSATAEAAKTGSVYPIARTIGQMAVPDDGKSGYPIRVNLGNPKTWKHLKTPETPNVYLPPEMTAPVSDLERSAQLAGGK